MGITLSQNSIYIHATLHFAKNQGDTDFTNLEKVCFNAVPRAPHISDSCQKTKWKSLPTSWKQISGVSP